MSKPDTRSGRFWTAWTLAWIGCWIGAFMMTHTPVPGGMRLPFHWADKSIHFITYFTIALVGARAAMSRGVPISGRWTLCWMGIYMAYGAADELLQPLVGRNCSFFDWLADVLGALAALGIVYLNRPRAEEFSQNAGPSS